MGLIYSDVDKKDVISSIKSNKIIPLSHLAPLTEETVNESINIVAQMGVEPIIQA
ncbi:unnamed protein product, partial [marine sediment metagenome]